MTDAHSDSTHRSDSEPETPFWLPALGFALFVFGGLAWAVTPPIEQATPEAEAAGPSATVTASATATTIQRARPPMPTASAGMFIPPPAPPTASASGSPHGTTEPAKATGAKPAKKHP